MALPMVEVYYKLVKAGSRTIDQVPENLRADVQAKIDSEAQPVTPEQPVQ